jgi:hypothetical protein
VASICSLYSVQSINRLERLFCEEIKWDLYISSSAYAKYYFALRALTEKKDFRRYITLLVKNIDSSYRFCGVAIQTLRDDVARARCCKCPGCAGSISKKRRDERTRFSDNFVKIPVMYLVSTFGSFLYVVLGQR